MDQLNTHSPASLYEIFPPEQAKRLADRLEIHHTPKHGSWLNMAEIEFSALARGLPERVGDRPALERHVAAWERRRNGGGVAADWRFTTADARIKLRKLYPTVRSGVMMLLHGRASATGFAWPKALGRPQPPFPLALAPHRTVGDELAVPHAPPDRRPRGAGPRRHFGHRRQAGHVGIPAQPGDVVLGQPHPDLRARRALIARQHPVPGPDPDRRQAQAEPARRGGGGHEPVGPVLPPSGVDGAARGDRVPVTCGS